MSTSLAVAVFVLAWSGLALSAAVYDGRFARTEARTPSEVAAPADATFRYAPIPATSGLRQVWVVYIRPSRADAAPPPGVSRWPEPGESVVSPAAQDALGVPGSWSSWSPGTVVGVIGPEGLASPTEAFAYVNPPAGASLPSDVWYWGASFGGTGVAGLGDLQSTYEWPLFAMLYGTAVVLPATLLLAGVWLVGSRTRRHNERILALLGATGPQRAAVRLRGVIVPWAGGAIGAAAVMAVAGTWNLTIPAVDFPLLAADVRRWAGPLAATWLGALLVSLLLLQAQAPQSQLIRRRRRDRPGFWQWLVAGLALFAVVGAIPVLNHSGLDHDTVGYLTMIALVVAVLTMPTLCAVTVWLIVARLRGRGGIGTTVGVGLLRQGRAQVSALAGAVGATLCLLTVVTVFVSAQDPFAGAQPVYSAALGHVATVGSSRLDLSLLTSARWRVLTAGADRVVLAVQDQDEEGRWRLYAEATSLTGVSAQGACRFARDTPSELRSALSSLDMTGCPRPLSSRPASAAAWELTVYRADGKLNPSTLTDAVSAWVAPPPVVDVPSAAFVDSGPLASRTQRRWIPWCASLGLILMLAALLQFAAGDLQLARRRIAGYLILGAPEQTARQAMAWRLALPVAVAVGYGAIFSLQRPLVAANREADYPFEWFAAYALVVVLGVAVAIGVNARAATDQLGAWRPGKARE